MTAPAVRDRALPDTPARAVIFDFNGTIVDDDALLAGIYTDLVARHGVRLEPGQYAELSGLPDTAMLGKVFGEAGKSLSEETTQEIVTERVDRYMQLLTREYLQPGVLDFLDVCDGKVPVAIASGAFTREITHALGLLGLDDRFRHVVGIDSVKNGKPDPEGFLVALDRINDDLAEPLSPAHVWVVEDSTDGVRAARDAGMRCVVVRGPAYDERAQLASLVVDHLSAELADDLVRGTRQ